MSASESDDAAPVVATPANAPSGTPLWAWALTALAQPPDSPPAPAPEPAAPVSASAQRVYDEARSQLFQVRTLLKGQDSQASVGSGFLVTEQGHIVTNYHVVSQAALQPERYRLVYSTADRAEGPLQLLAFDAIHDLAIVKPTAPDALSGRRPLRFRPQTAPMAQGERIYSLGNPLDVGFAVIEGTYNGLVERSFYPTIFFAGSLNPGVSGGPTLDQQGQVIGINVAARTDGEQVSFLVPAQFAAELLEQKKAASPITAPAYPELTSHLMKHQAALSELEQEHRRDRLRDGVKLEGHARIARHVRCPARQPVSGFVHDAAVARYGDGETHERRLGEITVCEAADRPHRFRIGPIDVGRGIRRACRQHQREQHREEWRTTGDHVGDSIGPGVVPGSAVASAVSWRATTVVTARSPVTLPAVRKASGIGSSASISATGSSGSPIASSTGTCDATNVIWPGRLTDPSAMTIATSAPAPS